MSSVNIRLYLFLVPLWWATLTHWQAGVTTRYLVVVLMICLSYALWREGRSKVGIP